MRLNCQGQTAKQATKCNGASEYNKFTIGIPFGHIPMSHVFFDDVIKWGSAN